MAGPVLVRSYAGKRRERAPSTVNDGQALPPISSYAFADILRAADSEEFQTAIDGIAEICAKNRMSLADEYASHLPPLGEITVATSTRMRPHLFRPGGGMRRALTSVPEASSGSSEGSRKSKKRGSIFSFRKQYVQDSKPMRQMCISSMGRIITVDTTTALTSGTSSLHASSSAAFANDNVNEDRSLTQVPAASAAQSSLQRLLMIANRLSPDGSTKKSHHRMPPRIEYAETEAANLENVIRTCVKCFNGHNWSLCAPGREDISSSLRVQCDLSPTMAWPRQMSSHQYLDILEQATTTAPGFEIRILSMTTIFDRSGDQVFKDYLDTGQPPGVNRESSAICMFRKVNERWLAVSFKNIRAFVAF